MGHDIYSGSAHLYPGITPPESGTTDMFMGILTDIIPVVEMRRGEEVLIFMWVTESSRFNTVQCRQLIMMIYVLI